MDERQRSARLRPARTARWGLRRHLAHARLAVAAASRAARATVERVCERAMTSLACACTALGRSAHAPRAVVVERTSWRQASAVDPFRRRLKFGLDRLQARVHARPCAVCPRLYAAQEATRGSSRPALARESVAPRRPRLEWVLETRLGRLLRPSRTLLPSAAPIYVGALSAMLLYAESHAPTPLARAPSSALTRARSSSTLRRGAQGRASCRWCRRRRPRRPAANVQERVDHEQIPLRRSRARLGRPRFHALLLFGGVRTRATKPRRAAGEDMRCVLQNLVPPRPAANGGE